MPTVQRLFPEVVAPMVIEVFAGSARLSQACQAVGFRTLAVDKSTKQSRYAIHCLNLTQADDVQALLDLITLEANNLELVHLAPPCGTSSAKDFSAQICFCFLGAICLPWLPCCYSSFCCGH